MPKYTIRGTELVTVTYEVGASTEDEAWENLSACLEGRDSYPDGKGNRISCDSTDFTRKVIGKPCPDIESWELFDDTGERLL